MNIPDYAISASIAVLYPLFFRKVADVATNRSAIGNTRSFQFISFESVKETPEDKKHREEQAVKLKKSNTVRFGTLLAAGIFAIILSYVLKQPQLVLGFGLAGVFSIFSSVYGYWEDMDDKVKVTMVGLALAFLMSSPALFKKYIGVLKPINY